VDADVEMKFEDPPSTDPSSSAKHGDISPINGSISNLVKPSTSKPMRKSEPSFEKLHFLRSCVPNLHILPSQLTVAINESTIRHQKWQGDGCTCTQKSPTVVGLLSESMLEELVSWYS
jgi:26S proteasome regulatory subunit N2